jgi:hypothetical protein
MCDKKFVSVAPGTILARFNPLNRYLTRAPAGKISRFPDGIREQLNLRLFNGLRTYEILAWLNGLPTVKAIVAMEFNGVPVSYANLGHWRLGGYQHWLCEKSRADIANIPCEDDGLAAVAANRACGKILEYLKTAHPAQINHRQLFNCAGLAFALMNVKQNAARSRPVGQDLCLCGLQAALQHQIQRLHSAAPQPFAARPNLAKLSLFRPNLTF